MAVAPMPPCSYQINDMGLPTRFSTSSATAINNSSQLLGFYSHDDPAKDSESDVPSFRWDASGGITEMDFSADGINDHGEMIGSCLQKDRDKRKFRYWDHKVIGYVYKGHQKLRLGVLAKTILSSPNSINTHGQIAGVIQTTRPMRRTACTWTGEELEILPMSEGFLSSEAAALNDHGQVVGAQKRLSESELLSEAVLWNAGKAVQIGNPPGCSQSVAKAVNNSGQIVVYGFDIINDCETINRRVFLWTQGQMQVLGVLKPGKDAHAVANGLNDSGQIVGNSMFNRGKMFAHACLWHQGLLFDLNTLTPKNSGWELISAQSINNHGQIACNGIYNNCVHAVLLMPD